MWPFSQQFNGDRKSNKLRTAQENSLIEFSKRMEARKILFKNFFKKVKIRINNEIYIKIKLQIQKLTRRNKRVFFEDKLKQKISF